MKLEQFPQAIADLQHKILGYSQSLRRQQESLAQFNAELEQSIAFDAELKNDAQRKARRGELQATEDYQALLLDVQAMQDFKSALEIQLELLRNQFAIAKLDRREAIAGMELASSQQAA